MLLRILIALTITSAFQAQAQSVEWRELGVDKTQTLSFDLAFGEEKTIITRIAAADLEMRALATHSAELVDGTIMAAILRTQPSVRIANSGGAYVDWQTDARTFQKIGIIEEDDFAITLRLPALEGADFVPNLKVELVLRPVTPESELEFLSAASLSEDVLGSQDYGLASSQASSRYPDVVLEDLVTLRELDTLSLKPEFGPCRSSFLVRTLFATTADLGAAGVDDLSEFPQECWASTGDALNAAQIVDDSAYQPDIRVRLRENSGDLIGFVFGATSPNPEQIFVQNTSSGWLYGSGDGNWETISNGNRVDVPFGGGVLAIRNPRGGETPDATENDAFVSYLVAN